MILLALDIGSKRIGVAKTDELGLMAHPIGFVPRANDAEAIAEIHKLVLEWKVRNVVIGLPKDMSGRIGKAAQEVMAFAELLKREWEGIEVAFWDERLSTKSCERRLIEGDFSRRKRRRVIDKLAAQEILQNYLDAHRNRFPAC